MNWLAFAKSRWAPWGVSFLLHAAILVSLTLVVWRSGPANDQDSQQSIVPLANLSESGSLGSLAPSPAHTLLQSPGLQQFPISSSPPERTSRANAAPAATGAHAMTTTPSAPPLIGVGGSSSDNPLSAERNLAGSFNTGSQLPGEASPFAPVDGSGTPGTPGSSGVGINGGSGDGTLGGGVSGGDTSGGLFATSMYGLGGNARKLVYLVDASGALVDSLPFVIQELKRSILALSDQQSFTVIFFQGDSAIEVPPAGLKWATAAGKDAVITWMDPAKGNITARDESNPIRALQLGLQYHPDLMFLLSDDITGRGRYVVEQQHLLAEIDRANTHHTKINTIQFIYPDPLAVAHKQGTMELIAQRSGGLYKFLSGRELGIQ